ncbi:MAG TPA: polysaccharide biosynthesis C-terminal domain-containing protein, partial [Gemmatimonadales bacterium]
VPEQLVAPGLFVALLGVAVLALGREWLNAARAMGLWVTAVAVAFALGSRLLRSRLPPPLSRAVPAHETRAWANAALPLVLVGGLQYANQEVGLLMLGAIAGAEAAGVYRVATRGADVVVSVLAALNLALAPTFAQLYATGDMRRLERLASIGTRLGLIASLPVVVSFGVFGSWILGTIFGSDFARGSTALAILGAGQLANAAAGPVGLLLNMTGHERDAALGVWWASIVNMILSALLIPMWGIEGAAVASATSVIARNITLAIRVRNRLGLRTFLV